MNKDSAPPSSIQFVSMKNNLQSLTALFIQNKRDFCATHYGLFFNGTTDIGAVNDLDQLDIVS